MFSQKPVALARFRIVVSGNRALIPVYRFFIDHAKSAYDLAAARLPEVGGTVLLDGKHVVVRTVVPLPDRFRERLGYDAYVFCEPRLTPDAATGTQPQ